MSTFVLVPAVFAAVADPLGVDIRALERDAARLLAPSGLVGADAPFSQGCGSLLLLSQAVAAIIVIAALLAHVRHEDTQMEGTASLLLKVAFIALVPQLQPLVLQTADLCAEALGYRPAAAAVSSQSLVHRLWLLVAQWSPPGSPYLDALQSAAATRPASGEEEAWALQAWNWARGFGVATDDTFHWLWQTFAGGLRAFAVFAGCIVTTTIVALTLTLLYLAEIARAVLFQLGCAVAPVFIAALGIETWRPAAAKYLRSVVVIAFWPVGWALTDLVVGPLADAVLGWMDAAVRAAFAVPTQGPVPTLAVAAPYFGWATLVVFGALTLGLCLAVAAAAFGVPLVLARFLGSATGASGSCTRRTDSSQPAAVPAAHATWRTVVPPAMSPVAASTRVPSRVAVTAPSVGVAPALPSLGIRHGEAASWLDRPPRSRPPGKSARP